MRDCLVCLERPAELLGNLCDECGASLEATTPLVPEQIISSGKKSGVAALLDRWGRPHYLDGTVEIGRRPDGISLAIVDSSVSRQHARLELSGTKWSIKDVGSTNGTQVGEDRIEKATAIESGDQITIGSVGFYFITPTDEIADPKHEIAGETVKPEANRTAVKIPNQDSGDESTFSGLPEIPVTLVEPTGGGGGYIKTLGKTVQLTTTQFEFVALLAKRMADEPHQADLVRGFVRSTELLADISWDTAHPSDNHVKQLVRRVRRALVRGEIGNLIESRHRFGYRFRIIPILSEDSV